MKDQNLKENKIESNRNKEEYSYIPLKKLLIEETDKIRKIKSIHDELMEEYCYILFPIESTIAEYFLHNKEITDKEVKNTLKNFIDDPFKEFNSEEDPLENAIRFAASIGAQEKRISLHELKLAIKCIITSIENRDFLYDEQAYLRWICAFFGYLNKEEIKEIENNYRGFGVLNNISKKDIDKIIDTLYPEK